MLSAHSGITLVFKIAFEEHGKKVSDLVTMMKRPKIGMISPVARRQETAPQAVQ
jgi:hypothetical protein